MKEPEAVSSLNWTGCRYWLALVLIVSIVGTGFAQDDSESSAIDWTQHAFPLQRDDAQLTGPGADWIVKNAASCQFVLFGEQHGVAGMPAVVAAVYTQLQSDDFDYLVMERGPWVSRQFSSNGVAATIQESPFSVAFDYDGEVRLLKEVEASFKGSGNAFWGVDQSLTAIHALIRLSQILPTHASRRAANGLVLKDALQGGRFISRDYSADLEMIRELAGPKINEEASLILDALEVSQSIFVAYHEKQRDEAGIGISDILREQYMKDQFDAYMAEAKENGVENPKCILKMGGAHVMEGVGTNGVRTLGDHLQAIAESNGSDALHISIRSHSAESSWPVDVFEDESMVLIDMRSLRELDSESALTGFDERMKRDVRQYDAVLLLRDAGSDSSVEIKGYEVEFRQGLLTQIAVVVLPFLVSISLIVPLARKLIQGRKRTDLMKPFSPWLMVTLFAVALITVITLQVLRLRRGDTPEVSQLTNAPWMLVLELVCVLLPIILCVLMFKKSWWSFGQRIHFMLVSASVVGMAIFTHWWNLGRMFG